MGSYHQTDSKGVAAERKRTTNSWVYAFFRPEVYLLETLMDISIVETGIYLNAAFRQAEIPKFITLKSTQYYHTTSKLYI